MNATSTPGNGEQATPADASGSSAQPASADCQIVDHFTAVLYDVDHAAWCDGFDQPDHYALECTAIAGKDDRVLATGRPPRLEHDFPNVGPVYTEFEAWPVRLFGEEDHRHSGVSNADSHAVVIGPNPEDCGADRYGYFTVPQARQVIERLTRAVEQCETDAAAARATLDAGFVGRDAR